MNINKEGFWMSTIPYPEDTILEWKEPDIFTKLYYKKKTKLGKVVYNLYIQMPFLRRFIYKIYPFLFK